MSLRDMSGEEIMDKIMFPSQMINNAFYKRKKEVKEKINIVCYKGMELRIGTGKTYQNYYEANYFLNNLNIMRESGECTQEECDIYCMSLKDYILKYGMEHLDI